MYGDDPVEIYLNEVGKVAPMTREREAECIRHIRSRDDHADLASKDLLEANLALVIAIAQDIRASDIGLLDLLQAGNNGLADAVRAVEEAGDVEDFPAFARPFIEKAILHHFTAPSH